MRKVLFVIGLCCLCLCGCGNNENKELLIGDWWMFTEEELTTGSNSLLLTFNRDNTFKAQTCLGRDCSYGESEWQGTYSIKNDVITLSTVKENLITKPFGLEDFKVTPPPDKLIVNFDNMYMCDQNEGLDCKEKYEKDAS